MASHLVALTFEATDPEALAHFWSQLLRRQVVDDPRGGRTVVPSVDTEFPIRFVHAQERGTGPNPVHFHLTSAQPGDQQESIDRALRLGATHLDVGQLPEEGHVVLADPEGNEFCVIEAGNSYLAGTGYLGELACDGTREVGVFWSEALGWPLVWDQDEETAVQSPRGGAKIAWGGPPVRPKTGRERIHLDLAPAADGDLEGEVARLESLGASRVGPAGPDGAEVAMTHPDGGRFYVVAPAVGA